jgi:PEP-CTERM motif
MKKLILALTLLGTTVPAFSQSTLTLWNFNSIIPDAATGTGTTTPATGSGTASLAGGMTATFASGDANGGSSDPASGDDSGWNLTTFAAQGTGDRTRGAQFLVSTVGFSDIQVSYDLRHSNTSSRFEQFQYTTDGATWTDFGSLFDGNAGDTWFNNRSLDLSAISAVENNALFGFRVVAAFAPSTSSYAPSSIAGTYGTAGTWRFDMVTVSATAIPEPSTYAMLLGLGVFGLIVLRRSRSSAARAA